MGIQRVRRAPATVGLVVVGLMVACLLPWAGPATAAAKASLTVGPSEYVPGEALTFSGSLGIPGVRKIRIQQHQSRAGDSWNDLTAAQWKTAKDGSFSFTFPGPAMKGLRLRVAGGGAVTPPWTADPGAQDVGVSLVSVPGLGNGKVVAGVPFVLRVDTVPTYSHRPDITDLIFKGRTLTLQRRTADLRWENVDTGAVDALGIALLTTTIDEPGKVVYRVRQEDYTAGGNRIGWFPSFPIVVEAVDLIGGRHAARATAQAAAPSHRLAAPDTAIDNRKNVTASSVYLWRTALWDFNWGYGESLSSKPERGSDLRGSWLDLSSGLGRVSLHNGQIELDSQRYGVGAGDFGTTSAILQGAAGRYGRWETRLRVNRFETGAKNFRALIELVPDKASDDSCGARTITVADLPVGGSTVGFGVTSGSGKEWSTTKKFTIGIYPAAFAVEVTKRHITWFINGTPIGTVRDKAALPKGPMTIRLRLVGQGTSEMNHTQLFADWVRGWSLKYGKQVSKGTKLTSHSWKPSC